MAAWPSFVPLMQQLVQSTLSDTTINHNLTVGEQIEGAILAEGATSLVRITRPDGNEVELQASDIDAQGHRSWSYRGTSHRGLYQAKPFERCRSAVRSQHSASRKRVAISSTESLPSRQSATVRKWWRKSREWIRMCPIRLPYAARAAGCTACCPNLAWHGISSEAWLMQANSTETNLPPA